MKTKEEKDQIIAVLEAALRNRLEQFGIKPNSATGRKEEAAFLSGAMCAINTVFPHADQSRISEVIPPRWILAVMRGASVLDPL